MSKTIIESSKAPAPIGPYSQAVKTENMLFVSGQVAINRATGNFVRESLEAEAHQVMKNIGHILSSAGLDYQHIVKTTIFLRTMDDFSTVNTVYASYFKGDFPARETVAVLGLPLDARVEISVTCLLT
jgi:2-iminobutanoate/2-iminopropanoate deaminase